jgi:hypothetical protein
MAGNRATGDNGGRRTATAERAEAAGERLAHSLAGLLNGFPRRSATPGGSAGGSEPGERGERNRRAEELVDRWQSGSSAMALVLVQRARQMWARAREGFEDILAEARFIRAQRHDRAIDAPDKRATDRTA